MILNKIKSKLFLLSLIMLSLLSPVNAYATEIGEASIPVTFILSENDRFNLNVKVIGNGTVYDGDKSIREGTMVYSLRVNEEKIFNIIPDEGHVIKSISWISGESDLSDRYSIKDIKKGTELTLNGLAVESDVTVEFEAGNNTGIDTPETGDKGIRTWGIVLIFALVAIIVFKDFEKK